MGSGEWVLRLKVAPNIVGNADRYSQLKRKLLAVFPGVGEVSDPIRFGNYNLHLTQKAEPRLTSVESINGALRAVPKNPVRRIISGDKQLILLVILSYRASWLDIERLEGLRVVDTAVVAEHRAYGGKAIEVFVPRLAKDWSPTERAITDALSFNL